MEVPLTGSLTGPADPPGATPLTAEDLAGLIPTDVATRADLDRAEHENIVEGRLWARERRWTTGGLLDPLTVRELHQRMFGDVWRWAGVWRRREVNIGVAPDRIPVELQNTLDDVRAWVEFSTFPAEEIAVRAHHRLVVVHPFANGNGRHARLFADLLVGTLGRRPFSWSGDRLQASGADRDGYLAALRAMDRDPDDVRPLLEFARGAEMI